MTENGDLYMKAILPRLTLPAWLQQTVIFGLIIIAVFAWQSRHLLSTDGSVSIAPQQLASLQGEVAPLYASGRQTLVYFFAPWCQVCRLSIGNLDSIASPQLDIVRVAMDYDSVAAVSAFVVDNQVQGQVLLGHQQLKQTFNLSGYPTYYLLDEQGQVISASMGYSSTLGLKLTQYLNQS